MIQSDDDSDSVMEYNPSFQIPRGGNVGLNSMNASAGADMLFNRRKISSDVISLASSGSGSGSGSGSDSGSDSGTTGTGSGSGSDYDSDDRTPIVQPGANGMFGGMRGMGATPANGNVMPSLDPNQDYLGNRMSAERSRAEKELNEKKEILYQMDRLESKGYQLPRKFNLQSDLEEMRVEFNRVIREKEVDASIRFQRKMMMAMVTGIEFLNTRFDPFDLRLDGWSEQVHENVTDYDDIFEELHEKYKSTGKKMAPELRLLMSLSGSAFMFHLTNSMFKQQPLPGVEQVLRSNPELMKQFQAAALNQASGLSAAAAAMGGQGQGGGGGMPQMPQMQQMPQPSMGGGGGMFGMIGNLFGSMTQQQMPTTLGRGPAPPPQTMGRPAPMTRENVETVIQDVHRSVRSRPPSNAPMVETMSAISDEEITSIIEDTADMVGLVSNGAPKRRGRPQGSAGGSLKRTLDL